MSTKNSAPATAPIASTAPVVVEAVKPPAIKTDQAKVEVKKPAVKKIVLTKAKPTPTPTPTPKLLPAAKKPVVKNAAVKKAAVKRPLSKAFAPVKTVKIKKPKLVRDSFTIPKAEYQVLTDLKERAVKLTRPTKKSELLRAGIKALAALSDAAFLTALDRVPTIKTGRPVTAK